MSQAPHQRDHGSGSPPPAGKAPALILGLGALKAGVAGHASREWNAD